MVFKHLSEQATLHREEARLLHCFVALKRLHVRVLKFLLDLEENGEQLFDELFDMQAILKEALSPFFQPSGIEWFMRLWLEPTADALSVKVKT